MATKIFMPALSPTMKKGKIANWMIQPGGIVEIGQVLAEIETDKAIMEFESTNEGVLGEILVPSGSEVEVGIQIAWLLESEDEIVSDQESDRQDFKNNVEVNQEINTNITIEKTIIEPSALSEDNLLRRNTHSTPAARARARELGVDITQINLGKRIKEADIREYAQNQGNSKYNSPNEVDPRLYLNEYELIDLSEVQKTIANRMVASKQEIPHFYIEMEVDLTELMKVKDNLQYTFRTTLTHWFMLSAGRAASQVPLVTRSWHNNTVHEAKNIDISFAVAIEDGLITPIVKNVEDEQQQSPV